MVYISAVDFYNRTYAINKTADRFPTKNAFVKVLWRRSLAINNDI